MLNTHKMLSPIFEFQNSNHTPISTVGNIVVTRHIKPRRPDLFQRSTRAQQRIAARLSHGAASSALFIPQSIAGPVNFDQ